MCASLHIYMHMLVSKHTKIGVTKLPGYCGPSITTAVGTSQPMRCWIPENEANQGRRHPSISASPYSTQTHRCCAVDCVFLSIATEPNISKQPPCILTCQRGQPILFWMHHTQFTAKKKKIHQSHMWLFQYFDVMEIINDFPYFNL